MISYHGTWNRWISEEPCPHHKGTGSVLTHNWQYGNGEKNPMGLIVTIHVCRHCDECSPYIRSGGMTLGKVDTPQKVAAFFKEAELPSPPYLEEICCAANTMSKLFPNKMLFEGIERLMATA